MNDNDRDITELEQMLRAAEGYVEASTDLRPRVLEAARAGCQERRVRRYLFQAAVLMMLVSFLTTFTGSGADGSQCSRNPWLLGELRPSARSASMSGAESDATWGTVDAFVDLRLRQAKALGRDL